jgi:hypothetical protein
LYVEHDVTQCRRAQAHGDSLIGELIAFRRLAVIARAAGNRDATSQTHESPGDLHVRSNGRHLEKGDAARQRLRRDRLWSVNSVDPNAK